MNLSLTLFWLVTLSSAIASNTALAALEDEINTLERLASGLSVHTGTQDGATRQIAEHRLVDAQVLYNLEDYNRAAILLYDYVTNYRDTPGYAEALFFLGDSLYHRKDINSARRYFELVATKVKGPYYQESLQRLIEIDLLTGDISNVGKYIDALNEIPQSQLKPSAPYVKGKYYYFTQRTKEAIEAFKRVGPKSEHYAQAQYFIGAALVRENHLDEALKVFSALLEREPASVSEVHVRELTHLAIGRLHYQSGSVDRSIESYQRISRESDQFDIALYEIAWSYVKAERLNQALHALDVLALLVPESPLMPEMRVLEANILIRMKKWNRATDAFIDTKKHYEPLHDQLEQVLGTHPSPATFFDLLLQRNLEQLEVKVPVPDVAIAWVKSKPEIQRVLKLAEDLQEIQETIAQGSALIERMNLTLSSPAKVRVFPSFAAAQRHALELDNRLIIAMEQIVSAERRRLAAHLSEAEQQQLEQLDRRRLAVEAVIRRLPKRAEEYRERDTRQWDQIATLHRDLSELDVLIDNMRAQLIAAEKYFVDSRFAKEKATRGTFYNQADLVRTTIVGLQKEVIDVKQKLNTLRDSIGVDGTTGSIEQEAKFEYKQLLRREHNLFVKVAADAPSDDQPRLAQLNRMFERAEVVNRRLIAFDGELERTLEQRLEKVRDEIANEQRQAKQQLDLARSYQYETEDIAGGITYAGFAAVKEEFYDAMVRSEVGMIDVAWALKDAQSKEVSSLVLQQKLELKMLEDEFAEILKDQ